MDNAKFWNERYLEFPQIGSGPGSRGYAIEYKRHLVKKAVAQYKARSIVDIGCGDLCWLDQGILQNCTYIGLDISQVAIERARVAYPTLKFEVHDVAAEPPRFQSDLVICFDVLIHQVETQMFRTALSNALSAIGKGALISYLTPPMADGTFPASLHQSVADVNDIAAETALHQIMAELPVDYAKAETVFHKSLPEAIAALRPDLEVLVAGQYRHQTVYRIHALGVGCAK